MASRWRWSACAAAVAEAVTEAVTQAVAQAVAEAVTEAVSEAVAGARRGPQPRASATSRSYAPLNTFWSIGEDEYCQKV